MADVIVYDPHAMNMDVEGMRAVFDALPDYPQKDFDFQLTVLIAEYANSKGVCWPGMGTLAGRLHCFKMDVKRGVDRILEFGFFAVKKVKSKGAKWEHNVYVFAKRFLRKTVDKLAAHFDTAKWKTWVEEKLSERQRKKLVNRYCEQADLDLEKVCASEGWWMARRYVAKHVVETPEEYDQILAEAIAKYRDYDGPLYREIAGRPVKPVQPVPAPVQEKPAEPAPVMEKPIAEAVPVEPEPVDPEPWLQDWSKPVEWDYVSEKDMDKMFRVFDTHPELVDDPVKAAEMAGVVLPEMKTVSTPEEALPANTPVEEITTPIQEPTATPEVMKRETGLEALPANTASTQSGPVQTDMANAPKFINGEVDARWGTQQLLHQLNPTMYPAY